MPTEPHPVNPVRPRPLPGPSRPAEPKPAPSKAALRMAIAVTAVGVLLLTLHYFAPVLLLAALPTKQWRAAA